MMRSICFAIGAITMSATAANARETVAPTAAQIGIAESDIGQSLKWPEGAKPIVDYDRHYFWDARETGLLRAQFALARKPGQGKISASVGAKGFVMDGGCSIVNLDFFGPSDPRNRLACGGR